LLSLHTRLCESGSERAQLTAKCKHRLKDGQVKHNMVDADLVPFVSCRVVPELLLCLVWIYLHAPHWQVSALQLHRLPSTDVLYTTPTWLMTTSASHSTSLDTVVMYTQASLPRIAPCLCTSLANLDWGSECDAQAQLLHERTVNRTISVMSGISPDPRNLTMNGQGLWKRPMLCALLLQT